MPYLNEVRVMGHLGMDPEIRSLPSGSRVCNLSIATTERWKDKTTGEDKEKTEWHRIIVYSDALIDLIEKFLKKGDLAMVDGSLQTRSWEDDSGTTHYRTNIVVQGFRSKIHFFKNSQANGNDQPQQDKPAIGPGSDSQSGAAMTGDELPF